MKVFSLFAVVLLLVGLAGAEEQWILDAPENAHWHPESRAWFVSNLGGGLSMEKDGYGWISRFDERGKLIASRWVEFLDAPTGMATVKDVLYVADRGSLVVIDIPTATIRERVELPHSQLANDVAAASNGDLYVSDTATNRIYRVRSEKVEIWLESDQLQNPNGLWVDENELIVATWGPLTDIQTFATKHPGTVLKVNLDSKKIQPMGDGKPIANFDGIVRVGEVYFATDWVGGRLLRITTDGEVSTVLRGFSQLADLGYSPETGTIGLPVMGDNRFILLHLDALGGR